GDDSEIAFESELADELGGAGAANDDRVELANDRGGPTLDGLGRCVQRAEQLILGEPAAAEDFDRACAHLIPRRTAEEPSEDQRDERAREEVIAHEQVGAAARRQERGPDELRAGAREQRLEPTRRTLEANIADRRTRLVADHDDFAEAAEGERREVGE